MWSQCPVDPDAENRPIGFKLTVETDNRKTSASQNLLASDGTIQFSFNSQVIPIVECKQTKSSKVNGVQQGLETNGIS